MQKEENGENRRKKTVTNQPIVLHVYYIFYSLHPIHNIYYSSYHDQLALLYIFFHSTDF